jgi:hypothetical protein
MSVYRDTNASVIFEHPHPGPLTATVYRDEVQVFQMEDLTPVGGTYTLALDWNVTQYDGLLTIVWSTTGFERKQRVEVVTPIVSLSQLKPLFDGEHKTDVELAELEQTVRVFIQAYTGQTFGYFVGTKSVTTKLGRAVLPTRINSITGVTGGTLRASADGFTLYAVPTAQNVPSTIEALDDLIDGYSHVIYAPGNTARVVDATYAVTGEWGYDFVPDEVVEAALLLANDFSQNETIYRDKYLQSIKIQQDTITYHPGAFRGTGNARADLLLGKYKKPGMVII